MDSQLSSDALSDHEAWHKLQELFAESLEVRRQLLEGATADDIFERAIGFVQATIPTQSVSIYLFDKQGYFVRRAIRGVDRNGAPIDERWFPGERYLPGESFTGKAVNPLQGRTFALPTSSNELGRLTLAAESRAMYEALLGDLRGAIAIPLNGFHRPFGVLEVLNRYTSADDHTPSRFSDSDVMRLFLLATSTAGAISALRRRNEFHVLSHLASQLILPFADPDAETELHADAVRLLTDELTPYSAAVVRVLDGERLPVVARLGPGLDWSSWVDEPSTTEPSPMELVVRSGKSVIIQKVAEEGGRLPNLEWMRSNGIVSYACFPLLGPSGTAVGTLSMFTRYEHQLSGGDQRFLASVAALLASAIESGRSKREEMARDFEYRALLSSRAGQAGYDASDAEADTLRHTLKNELLVVHTLLKRAIDSSGGRLGHVRQALARVQSRIESLESDLTQDAPIDHLEMFNPNDVVRDVVRIEKQGASIRRDSQPIEFSIDLDEDIPVASAEPGQIRILFENLLNNAVRAIRHAKVRVGRINVWTRITEYRSIRYFEFGVEDNGIGISNENKARIFQRRFTTYENGTGMGLFTVHQIVVERYGGHVLLESSVGSGASFRVLLPLSALSSRTTVDQ